MYTTIDMGIFQGTIFFSCGYSIKALKKSLKKTENHDWNKGLKKYNEYCSGVTIRSKFKYKGEKRTYYYVILPERWTGTDHEYVTLAHELIHVVQYKLTPLLNRDNEAECEAYTHTHLMTQVLNKLRDEKI